MDAAAHLVDAVSLDTHNIVAQVEVDVDDVLVVIFRWNHVIAHVLDKRLGLECLRSHTVDVGEEVLVEDLFLGDLARLASELLELLNLLAVQLLDIRRDGREAPQVGDELIPESVREAELGEGILDGVVDGRLHFRRGALCPSLTPWNSFFARPM